MPSDSCLPQGEKRTLPPELRDEAAGERVWLVVEQLVDRALDCMFQAKFTEKAEEEGIGPEEPTLDPVALTFARFDVDGGGSISRRELRKALESLG